jgi:hypothetical protein
MFAERTHINLLAALMMKAPGHDRAISDACQSINFLALFNSFHRS